MTRIAPLLVIDFGLSLRNDRGSAAAPYTVALGHNTQDTCKLPYGTSNVAGPAALREASPKVEPAGHPGVPSAEVAVAAPKPGAAMVTDASNAADAAGASAELNGRRKSLFIGINYYGTQAELHGCVDDVHRMLPLVRSWGFPDDEAHCRVLLDSPDWPVDKRPTKANIKAAISWLVSGAAAGDALFMHYSGHGGREPRTDGRGEWHETLCPVDMEESGMLMDSELFECLVRPLPSGCRLTCILDACHSAGALDLPYIFMGTPENIKKALAGEAVQMAMSKNWLRDFERWEDDPSALLGDVASVGLGLWDMWSRYKASTSSNQEGFCQDEPGNVGLAVGEVVAITGCASDQTSADVGDVHSEFQLPMGGSGGHVRHSNARSTAGGALTSAFIESMDPAVLQGSSVSHLDLLEHLRSRLAEAGYSQVPQLASSMILDLKQSNFSLTSLATTKQRNANSNSANGQPPGWAGSSQGAAFGSFGGGGFGAGGLGCGGPMGGGPMGGGLMGDGLAGLAMMGAQQFMHPSAPQAQPVQLQPRGFDEDEFEDGLAEDDFQDDDDDGYDDELNQDDYDDDDYDDDDY